MPSLIDVGNGVKLVDTSKADNNAVEEATKQLNLIDIAGKVRRQPIDEEAARAGLQRTYQEIQAAPTDLLLKQQQAVKNNADIQNIETDSLMKKAQLHATLGAESRAQNESYFKGLQSLPEMLNQNPEIAMKLAPHIIPGLAVTQNKDKTFTATLPDGQGGVKTFPMDTLGIWDPIKKAEAAKTYRENFEKTPNVEQYVTQQDNFNNLKQLATLRTGASDLSMLFAIAKIDNPSAVVREGVLDSLKGVQGLPDEVRSAINRATNKDAPIFANDKIRQRFVQAAAVYVENGRQSAIQTGQNAFGIAHRLHLNPEDVVSPRGTISMKDFVPQDLADKYPHLLNGSDTATPPPPLGGAGNNRATQSTQPKVNGTPIVPQNSSQNSTPNYGNKLDSLLRSGIFQGQ